MYVGLPGMDKEEGAIDNRDLQSEKEQDFEGLLLSKGFIIKKISDDGNCLFGAVADQVRSF